MFKKPKLIAEIGGNHQGDFEKAKELVHMACESDVDFVKLQTYFADTLVEKTADPQRWAHFKGFELSIEQHVRLAEIVVGQGKQYLSSIWDMDSYLHLAKFLTHVKIGSGDANCYSFLQRAANVGKPIILSTGLCSFDEVSRSVKLLREFNSVYQDPQYLTILQCTSMYPIPASEANLGVMSLYRTLGCSVGYSDHTLGTFALKAASLLGAEMLEFHFTDDKTNQSFRDHQVSLTLEDVGELVLYLSDVEEVYGVEQKRPTASELSNGHHLSFRRGTYASRGIKAGTVLTEDDLVEKRPLNAGLRYEDLLGRVTTKDIEVGSYVEADGID